MSTGRGRGYTGRHQLRSPRPGAPGAPGSELEDSPLSPPPHPAPLHNPPKADYTKEKRDMEKLDKEKIKEVRDIQPPAKADGPAVKYHMNPDDEGQLKELLCVDEQYTSLLSLLEQFSPGEDGIQFNRKLRHFETTVTNMCPDEAHLTKAFATFRAAALQSSVTARKLAAVGASFTRQQRQQLLRGALLNVVMQGTFAKLDILERANPSYLINAANLMGDYFAEARLCNGNKVHILASPLLQYMRALLGSGDIRAHRSLATQLMQNGRELLSVLAQELDDLSISIRLRLLSPPPVSIIWLLLSADLCLNKFLPLPNTLQQFYASHLELTSDENFSEVSYGSWKKSPEKEDFRSDASGSDISEKVSQNLSQINLSQEEDAKPKLRPILGAGAGLLRQEQAFTVSQESFDTWASKSNLAKRYDLNSWRQVEDENKEEDYNPTVLPPQVIQNYQPVPVPDYPPPNVRFNNVNYPQENFANYLQQGDGTYIQNQYQNNANFNSQGDFVYPSERPEKSATYTPQEKNQFQSPDMPPEFVPQFPQNDRPVPERVNNEVQKNASRRPVENWRKEKSDLMEDPNRNRPKNWTRQRSKDNINDEEKDEKFKTRPANARVGTRLTRRNSNESAEPPVKPVPRRHVSEAPRNHKYWDHDDRTDKDYTS